MKKKLLITFLFLSLSYISSTLSAQDIITTQNGDRLSVKITEVRQNDVSYLLNNKPITSNKADIVSITFENGDTMTFGKKNKNRWYKEQKHRGKKHGGSISPTSIMWGCIASVGVLGALGFFILCL